METILTYQYRIKDSSTKKLLVKLASNVNFIWNFCNEVVRKRYKESRQTTNESFLNKLTKGSSKEEEISINSQTVQATYEDLLKKVKRHKKYIRFRSRKTKLGWVPFKGQTIKFFGSYCTYNGFKLKIFEHRKLPENCVINCGSFTEDARGRWYLNLVVTFPEYLEPTLNNEVGIDLGIKTIVALSTGENLNHDNFSKELEVKLARAQRRKKKREIQKVHAKIRNKRKDWNHKQSYMVSKEFKKVFVGDTSSEDILTEFSKINRAVYDASWYEFKTFLAYKVVRRQGCYLEVSEKDSNEICSDCFHKREDKLDLNIREWVCSKCRTLHNRDTNAARNHLRFGSETLKLKA